VALREFVWPAEKVAPRPTEPAADPYVRCYLKLRLIIGILGLAVPAVLIIVEPLLFDGWPYPRGSLSAYYYSGMREVFVGALCAIGVFLITYKVSDRTRENRLSTLAGVAVILVALFPTGKPYAKLTSTPLQDWMGEVWVERIHFASAAVFIGSLAVISSYFARRRAEDTRPGRERSLRFHWACCVIIVAALALAAVHGIFGWPDKGILIAEVAAVMAFGASWLKKGLEIREYLGEKKAGQARLVAQVPPPTPS
jgi:hypothetical protein